jgi:phenylacetate-CoA ligase
VIRYRTGDVTRFVDDPCPCGRTFRRIARFSGRVDDMLVIRGVNVFPSEIEAEVLAEPSLGGSYAIVVDSRGTMKELEVIAELAPDPAAGGIDGRAVEGALRDRLLERLRLRVEVAVVQPGALPRPESGKARRVFERTGEEDAFASLRPSR